jgi:dUTP pyrophosphatase
MSVNTLKIFIQIHDSRIGTIWKIPSFATSGSKGLDLLACVDDPITLHPNETLLISTGISCLLNDDSYGILITPRSSMGHKYKILISNTPGLVDNDYTGTLYVSLWNRGSLMFNINPGDRIAQAIFPKLGRPEIVTVNELPDTNRGNRGFGSTGIRDYV